MITQTIIVGEEKKAVALPMGGEDSRGNKYGADNISLLRNGERFLPVMGEFHYSRYEPEDWEEEVLKMRAGGVSIVATYVFWNHHEEREGEWDFSGCRNLRGFLEVCRRVDMPVWLRIGPWAHGECRNGGFPDWLLASGCELRTNDPVYLEKVRRFWGKLGEQAQGEMCKDGGPVLGIQLENEYGHCGGPSDREEGMAHMRTLKKMAEEAGFSVPFYTATGWGGAYVVDGETLPVLGGYVDAPWAEHVQEMPASANFVFSPYKQDENIGSDLKRAGESPLTFDISANPYLTAELGGGLQPTSHRRTYPWPEDIEAQSLCMLGSGANLLGYYMYHGGINPDGKYSTLQESRATGYNNDVPVKSYDFQTCIRQSGELGKSFGKLKKLHLMLEDFGSLLAGADAYFPEGELILPEDCHTLRAAVRINREAGVGFLFINNHQRKRKMEDHTDCAVELKWRDGTSMVLEHISVKGTTCGVFPFRLPFGKALPEGKFFPEQTNAALLCRLGERLFFYSDLEKPFFRWREKPEDVVVLTVQEADRAFRVDNRLYLTERADSCLIVQNGRKWLITKACAETLTVYGESGSAGQLRIETEEVKPSAQFEWKREERDGENQPLYCEYQLRMEPYPVDKLHQLYLEIDYAGDRAEVYLNGRLADDWFTTGEKWHLALKRFGYPQELTVRIYPSNRPLSNPYGNQVYYDLPVEKGCMIRSVRAVPEYRLEVED